MKRVLILFLVLAASYVAFDEYKRWQEVGREPFEEAPHWEEVEREMVAARASKPTADRARGADAPAHDEPLATHNGWSEGGGLVGRVGSFFQGIVDAVMYFFFGSFSTQPAVDLAAHFGKVEDATVSIDYGLNAIGAPLGGATGFIMDYRGKRFVATNIHVIEGLAESEAILTWYEGPKSGPYGERNTRFARNRIAFHTFPIPGRGKDPSYLDFMAQTELPSIKTRDGRLLRLGRDMLVSRTRDVVLIPVEADIPPLELSKVAPQKLENVFIVSNPEAKGTVYLVRGSIQGLGPDRLELSVDGKGLVEGMSGSPVVCAKTGGVLGMVSYSWTRSEFDPERVISEEQGVSAWGRGGNTRAGDFAYRLDNLNDLSPVSWSMFCREMGIIHALHERTRNVLYAVNVPIRGVHSNKAVPHKIQPDFNGSVSALHSSMVASHQRHSATQRIDRYASFDAYRRQLEHALDADMRQLADLLKQTPVSIPYLQRLVEDTVERDQQLVLQYIRRKSGNLPSRPNR